MKLKKGMSKKKTSKSPSKRVWKITILPHFRFIIHSFVNLFTNLKSLIEPFVKVRSFITH